MAGSNRPPRPRKIRDDGWSKAKREKFLTVLAMTANVTLAAKAANKARATAYTLRDRDPDFDEAWKRALDSSLDDLYAALLDRAKNGTERPVYYQGKKLETVRTYPDGMGMRLLARYRPTLHHRATIARRGMSKEAELDMCTELSRALRTGLG